MRKDQPPIGLPADVQRKSGSGSANSDKLNAILHEVLNTREARQLLITVVSELLNVWAERSWWKQKVSQATGFVVNKQLSASESASANDEIGRLFEDETFVKNIVDQLPAFIHLLSGVLETGSRTLDRLSTNEKKDLLANLLTSTAQGRTGALVTSLARMLNAIHNEDCEFLARILEPGFKNWIESMDFGELKEALENSTLDAQALATMANDVIWEYPAKVVLLLSLLPTIANITAGVMGISAHKLNAAPPDLLTDIMLAFLNEIDFNTMARVVNALTEIVRKIHTGSALLGEPGAPQLPKVLADTFDQIIATTDPNKFWKARIALAELKAGIDQQWFQSVKNHPEHSRLGPVYASELFNIRLRSKNQQLSHWDLMDDEELSACLLQHLSGYDAQEAAEVINNMMRIANRLGEHNPAVWAEFLRQFVNAVDDDELAGIVRLIFTNMREELRPAARAVVPGLVEWVCATLQSRDDEFEDEAARAREALRTLLIQEEV